MKFALLARMAVPDVVPVMFNVVRKPATTPQLATLAVRMIVRDPRPRNVVLVPDAQQMHALLVTIALQLLKNAFPMIRFGVLRVAVLVTETTTTTLDSIPPRQLQLLRRLLPVLLRQRALRLPHAT